MKITDMELAVPYAYNRGHHGRTQAVLMLDFNYYLVTRTETDVVVRKSVGRHTKPMRGARGLLAVPAPEAVWSLVRDGKEINSSLFDEVYSRYLIITDNLPEHENDLAHFSLKEFGDAFVLTPAQVPGRLVDQFATQEERQRLRDEKYAAQAAEEQRRRDAFRTAEEKAHRHGVTNLHYSVDKNGNAKIRMPVDAFVSLMALVPGRKKR
jgi:hypothetical protein